MIIYDLYMDGKFDAWSFRKKIEEMKQSGQYFSGEEIRRLGLLRKEIDCPDMSYFNKQEFTIPGYGSHLGPKIVDWTAYIEQEKINIKLANNIGVFLMIREREGGRELIDDNISRIDGLPQTRQAVVVSKGECSGVILWDSKRRESRLYNIKMGRLELILNEKDVPWLGLEKIEINGKQKTGISYLIYKRDGKAIFVYEGLGGWIKEEEDIVQKKVVWNCVDGYLGGEFFNNSGDLVSGLGCILTGEVGDNGEARLVIYEKETNKKWKRLDWTELSRNMSESRYYRKDDLFGIVNVKFINDKGRSFVSVNEAGKILIWQKEKIWKIKSKIELSNTKCKLIDCCVLSNNRLITGDENGKICLWLGSSSLDIWGKKDLGRVDNLIGLRILSDGRVVALNNEGKITIFGGSVIKRI